jgi:predicted chitinase
MRAMPAKISGFLCHSFVGPAYGGFEHMVKYRLRRLASMIAAGTLVTLACSGGAADDVPNFADEEDAGSDPTASGGMTGSGGADSGTGASSSGGAPSESTGGSSNGSCNYPDWEAGTSYSTGDIVRYPENGMYYIAENDNPGYDPTISTWFWEPYTCSGGGSSGSGGSDGTGGSGPRTGDLCGVLTESVFNQIFPADNRHSVYTYSGFLEAVGTYPEFAGSSNETTCKRELAAFFANVAWETGRLRYAEQIAKDRYCSSRGGCECDSSTSDQNRWYYGRGALQLSWNYNYCSAGAAYGVDLLGNPGRVASEGRLAWGTGLWFWMSSAGAGSQTCHASMTGSGGFGETIRSINGSIECNGGNPEAVNGRVQNYIQYCSILGVDPGGSAGSLGC